MYHIRSLILASRRRMNVILDDINDGQIITGVERYLNFMTFVFRRKPPEKTSTRKFTRPGIEPGPAAKWLTLLHLYNSGGPFGDFS